MKPADRDMSVALPDAFFLCLLLFTPLYSREHDFLRNSKRAVSLAFPSYFHVTGGDADGSFFVSLAQAGHFLSFSLPPLVFPVYEAGEGGSPERIEMKDDFPFFFSILLLRDLRPPEERARVSPLIEEDAGYRDIPFFLLFCRRISDR